MLIIVIIIGTGCKVAPTEGNGDPVDTTAPVISAVSTSNVTDTGAVITWTTDEPADSQVEYGNADTYGTSSSLATTLVTSHTVTLQGLTPDTLYHFRVKSSDAAGNQSISTDYTFTTLEPDITPPVISGITATSTSETSATITWITDEPSTSKVEYGTSVSYGQTTLNSTLKTSHSVTIDSLFQDTTYHFQVASSDGAGNEATSADDTFTTLAVDPDGVATAAVEDDIFDLVNTERTSRGLSALTRSDDLDTLAGEYAASRFLEESDITYIVYNAWHLDFSFGAPRFDEDTAQEQIDYCMGEPTMRDALLTAEAMETGIGIATISNTIYFTQVFYVIRTSGGDGEPIILTENPAATDPTWEQLKAFLEADTTDEIPYVLGSFICGDFAETLHNNAEGLGIRAAYVSVQLNQEPGHALNAFNVGGTVVFIDVGSADKVAYIEVGKGYGAVVLDAAEEFTYAYFETYVARFEAYLADMDDYSDDVAAYNAEVASYNGGSDPVPEIYDSRIEWGDALQDQQAELAAQHEELAVEKAALGIGDTYFHPTEALAVDDPTVADYYVHW